MTASRNDSPKAEFGAGTPEPEVDWGNREEEILRRKVLFAAAVAVVCCLGIWMLLTSTLGSGPERPALSVTDLSASVERGYTVVLHRCDRDGLERMERLIASDERLQQLAGPNEFWHFRLPDGQYAVCVGWAEEEDSPELQRLQAAFRAFEGPNGVRPFRSASVQSPPD